MNNKEKIYHNYAIIIYLEILPSKHLLGELNEKLDDEDNSGESKVIQSNFKIK